MEQHLERALIELYYALAEFEQAKASAQWGASPDQAETLFISMRLSRWGLETALRGLREIKAADSNNGAH